MSGMDRLDDAALDNIVHGNSICTMAHVQRMARELLAHRRASQAAPAPSDGLREAVIRGLDGYTIEDGSYAPFYSAVDAVVAALTSAQAQEGGKDGPYTCRSCTAATWNDSDVCDDCVNEASHD